MSRLAGLLARLRSLAGRRELERRMDAEFRFHLDMQTEHNIRLGMTPGEARRRALMEFGGADRYREEMREGRGLALLREMLGDARLSLRMFRREPGFSVVVVLTLALAIGATTAVFTLMRRAVLEPLPYPDAGRLMALATRYAGWGLSWGVLSEPEVRDLEEMTAFFSGVSAWRLQPVDLAREGGAQAERVRGLFASGALLPVLQVRPSIGRSFQPTDDLPGAAPVVLVTHALWRKLGADSTLVGRELWLNATRHQVLGVLPASFDFADAEVVLPLRLDPANPGSRGGHYLNAVGRLAPGVSAEQARVGLELTSARLRQDFPENYRDDMQWSLVGRSLRDSVLGDSRDTLRFLAGAVVLVLLIACVNVANLFLARLGRKEREVALRTALGAGRGRLVRQLLTEGFILALFGTAAGIVVATVGANVLLGLSPGAIPRVERLGIDAGMLITAIGLAGGSALLFGLAPALRGTRAVRGAPAVWGPRGASAEGWGSGIRGFMATLVTAEVALSLLVVISAGLLVRSYAQLSRVDLGFEPRHVLAFDVTVPSASYPTPDRVSGFFERLIGMVENLPGVEDAGGVRSLPLRSGTGSIDIELEDRPTPPGESEPSPNFQVVTPGYFEAMGISLVAGRFPAASDDARSPLVAWVNAAAAARLWPGESALGRRFRFAGDTGNTWLTVAGVVGNVRTVAASSEPVWEYFLAHAQLPRALDVSEFHRGLSIVARSATDPEGLADPVRAVVAELDPLVAPARLETFGAIVSRAIARPRLVSLLLSAFALLAAILATVGIYGVLSYVVSRRTREIGIRMALGARGTQVVRLMAVQGLEAVAVGILIGAAGALAATRLMSTLLFGVGARDPLVFGLSAAAVAAVALAAALIPARRAARVHPMETLRAE